MGGRLCGNQSVRRVMWIHTPRRNEEKRVDGVEDDAAFITKRRKGAISTQVDARGTRTRRTRPAPWSTASTEAALHGRRRPARWAVVHRWGPSTGRQFTNVLLQAILYLGRRCCAACSLSDARLMAAIRVFIALECVGLVVVGLFHVRPGGLDRTSSTTSTTNFQFRDPLPTGLGQYHDIRHDDLLAAG